MPRRLRAVLQREGAGQTCQSKITGFFSIALDLQKSLLAEKKGVQFCQATSRRGVEEDRVEIEEVNTIEAGTHSASQAVEAQMEGVI